MKSADLQVGQDYFVSRDRDWKRWGGGQRVRIIDRNVWSYDYSRVQSDKTFPTESGNVTLTDCWAPRRRSFATNGVLVQHVDKDGTPQKGYNLALPQSIKGPWEQCEAERIAYQASVKESYERRRRQEQEDKERHERIEEQLAQLGVTVSGGSYQSYVQLSFDEAEKVIDKLLNSIIDR